jgi:quercetin dioxygenase-like cupin family protein
MRKPVRIWGLSAAIVLTTLIALARRQSITIAQIAATTSGPTSRPAEPVVTYFDHDKVAESFRKGGVLFNDNGANYQVHTSRRMLPGMVEVHTKDTDIIYVIEGTATFITGGTIVAPKAVAPDQVRGQKILDGEEHQLAKGDVIIVPAGVAHWFVKVSKPFLYYVVKVR